MESWVVCSFVCSYERSRRSQANSCCINGVQSGTGTGFSPSKTGLHPQRLCHFAWQPQARVSPTLRLSHVTHVTAAATSADEYWHFHRSFWLQKHIYIRAHDFAYSPDMRHQPRPDNVTCAWSWRLCGTDLPILRFSSAMLHASPTLYNLSDSQRR